MLPVLVTCLDSSARRAWGLRPEHVPAPFLALPAPVGIREALARAREAYPDARQLCYAQAEWLDAFFSRHYLYEGALHRWLASAPRDALVFRRIDLPQPADLLCVSADRLAAADPMAPSTHTGEIELDLLRGDPRPKTLVFGDSHVFNLYTAPELIGLRGVVVEQVEAGGVEQLKVSRHIGPVTMHRLAERGEITADFLRQYGLRPGDRAVAVCGEIDVRNHVGRIAAEQCAPEAHVIQDLCARFCATLAAAVADFGPLEVVLSCPTPPLDFSRLDPSKVVEHFGTLAERTASTREMRRCLEAESRARGWTVLDLTDAFADEHGALDFERSDKFCHVSHAHKAPALAALHEVMARRNLPSRGKALAPRRADAPDTKRPQRGSGLTEVTRPRGVAREQWSPELEFVARLSRIAPTEADLARVRALADTPLDWGRVVRLAEHHGVAALVDRALTRLELTGAPPHTRSDLRLARLASVRDDLARYDAWLNLCRAFAAQDVPALTMKGFHVVLAVYGEIGLRPVGDLDFLVRRDDVPRALALLEALGYHPTDDWQAALHHVGIGHIVRSSMEIGLASSRGIAVDLHWEAGASGTTPTAAKLIAGAERMRVEGQEILVSPRAMAVTLLLLHGRKDAWRRLRWLVDVAEWLDRFSSVEYDEVVRRLEAFDMRSALGNALALMERLWGRLPVVSRDDPRGRESANGGALRYHQSVLERERDWGHLFDRWRPLRMLRDRLGVAPSLGAAMASAFRPNHFDWAYIALPPSLRFAYYLVRPVRIIPQLVQRGERRGASAQRRVSPSSAVQRDDAAAQGRARTALRRRTPLTLVTAIYGSGPDSLLGGRGRDLSYYLPSLVNIGNLGAPIVIYCSAGDVGAIAAAVAPHFHDYRVVPFELPQFEHFARFEAWKKEYVTDLKINDRNEVLCFLKSYWVQQTMASNPFDHETFFWIDAGLTHHGIFPERVGGVELRVQPSPAQYFPANPANIFTPRLGAALARSVVPGRVTFCALPMSPGAPRRERYEAIAAATTGTARERVQIDHHLAGGFFGGHRADLAAVHQIYAAVLDAFIASKIYTLEEQVFSAVHAVRPDLFTLLPFGTWAFFAPGERTSGLEAEGPSFYKIFVALAGDTQPSEVASRERPAGAMDPGLPSEEIVTRIPLIPLPPPARPPLSFRDR